MSENSNPKLVHTSPLIATATLQLGSCVKLAEVFTEIRDKLHAELFRSGRPFRRELTEFDRETIIVTGILLTRVGLLHNNQLIDIEVRCLVPDAILPSVARNLAASSVYIGVMRSRFKIAVHEMGRQVFGACYATPVESIDTVALREIWTLHGSVSAKYKPAPVDVSSAYSVRQPESQCPAQVPSQDLSTSTIGNAFIDVEFTMADGHDPEVFIGVIRNNVLSEFMGRCIGPRNGLFPFNDSISISNTSTSSFLGDDKVTRKCSICVHLAYDSSKLSDHFVAKTCADIVRDGIDRHPLVSSSGTGPVKAGSIAACVGATVHTFSGGTPSRAVHYITWEPRELEKTNMSTPSNQDQLPVTPLQPDPIDSVEVTGEGAYYDAVNEKNILLRECKWTDVANCVPPEGERVLCQTDHKNYTQTAILTRWGKFWFRADTHVPTTPTRWAQLNDLLGKGSDHYK